MKTSRCIRYQAFNWCVFPLFSLPAAAAAAKFRRESLFCPDELDSLFSYFDTGSGPRSKSSHHFATKSHWWKGDWTMMITDLE